MSGDTDTPDAGESIPDYEAGGEAASVNYSVGQRKIIGISSGASTEELSLELDEGIVGDEEVHKEEQGEMFPKVSRSFKTSTPLRTDEIRPPIEDVFKTPQQPVEERKVPARLLEDELRLSSSVETAARTPHNKVAAYLQSLPPPPGKVDTIIDKLCDKMGNGEGEEGKGSEERSGGSSRCPAHVEKRT